MAFVSPPLSIPTSLGGHTGFDERPSSGMTSKTHDLLDYLAAKLFLSSQRLTTKGASQLF